MSSFPHRRMRRLRRSAMVRELRRETTLLRKDMILPLFVVEDAASAGPVASMPGIVRHRLVDLNHETEQIGALGLRAVILFGLPARKDAAASSAFADEGVVPQAIRRIKAAHDRLLVFTDVCLCQYTNHGHCGIVRGETIDNDATLEVLSKVAISHTRAGADFVAPSGMMDGAVRSIRLALDGSGFADVGILSYAVKYASAFYGPFREAADSTPQFGDRRSYQMDPANAREALAEAQLDVDEGADILMVKPALPYLDVVRAVREAFPAMPLAAYQVSGEYSMIKAASAAGWLDERRAALESLTAIKRAGADLLITYYAKEAASWLANEQ